MTCIVRALFKCPCPTCGVTRAMISLLKSDIKNYCDYNIMGVPLCIATILMVLGERKNNKAYQKVSGCIFIINIVYYIYRLYSGNIP
ncbi:MULTISPECIES: DUF2752 domain-containing protein [unclassified Treponema]|uniref:DUF2752 domain-containing protein n=1 Tax=unclassified Treponema TaxID=2638727 RepID=UPI0021116A4F|nr:MULTISPECIES: DUF2752 domain-containing protein [unclassified Treponema]UTC67821.1 DUF2752 domain-containing protein [Treponema sp. OMZ 789]UTC67876.1 DUF2752 domain-containing protein [Treponema sp. OMZ 789]UTC70546.1 DUF2752 domain-containing protein [Treponema sp. OMZ 790]UTC70596.1 DUF2752 domain-containing protein [Treponema sp. OMZ 790]UTC73257.1 DUF2752 domain-containing protein [Treponema sp. OMZ 791]